MCAHPPILGLVALAPALRRELVRDLVADLVERRQPPLAARAQPHRVQAEVGLKRSDPVAGRQREHGLGERGAEQHRDLLARRPLVRRAQRRTVADRIRRAARAQRGDPGLGVRAHGIAALARAEEDLVECHELRRLEARGRIVIELAQLRFGARRGIGEVLREIAHLLDQPPPYLVVVRVELERERLPVQHLVADSRLEQRRDLVVAERAALGQLGRGANLRDLLGADHDPLAARADPLAVPRREREQDRAYDQKMKQRVLENSRHRSRVTSPRAPRRARLRATRRHSFRRRPAMVAKKRAPASGGGMPGP